MKNSEGQWDTKAESRNHSFTFLRTLKGFFIALLMGCMKGGR